MRELQPAWARLAHLVELASDEEREQQQVTFPDIVAWLCDERANSR